MKRKLAGAPRRAAFVSHWQGSLCEDEFKGAHIGGVRLVHMAEERGGNGERKPGDTRT